MSGPYQAVTGFSICWRCQVRLSTARPLAARWQRRSAPRRPDTRNFFSRGSVRQQTEQEMPAKHDLPGTNMIPPNYKLPVRYTAFDKQIGHIERLDLEIKALGKSVSALSLEPQLPKESDWLYKQLIWTDGEPKPEALSTKHVMTEGNANRGFIDNHDMFKNLEDIGAQYRQSGSAVTFISDAKYFQLFSQLVKGFQRHQLEAYCQQHLDSRPVHDVDDLSKPFSSAFIARSSWVPGIFRSVSVRSPRIGATDKLETEGAATTSRNKVPHECKKNKDKLAVFLLERVWKIAKKSEAEEMGVLDVQFRSKDYDLVLKHRRNPLRQLAETYGVTLKADRTRRTIRIAGQILTCDDVFRLMMRWAENIVERPVVVKSLGDAKGLLANVSKLSSAIIEKVDRQDESALSGDASSTVSVTFLGPDEADFEYARKILVANDRTGEPLASHTILGQTLLPHDLILAPQDTTSSFPLSEQSRAWGRWTSRPLLENRRDDKRSPPQDKLQDFRVGRKTLERVQKLFEEEQTRPVLSRGMTNLPYWNLTPSPTVSASVGQVIYRSDVTGISDQYGHRSDASVKRFENLLPSFQQAFATSVEGTWRPLLDSSSPRASMKHRVFITLVPKPPPELDPKFHALLPKLELKTTLSKESSGVVYLDSARLILEETDCHVLMPSAPADLSFKRRVHFYNREKLRAKSIRKARKHFDPALLDFVAACQPQMSKEGSRFHTPKSLELTLPLQALRWGANTARKDHKSRKVSLEDLQEELDLTRLPGENQHGLNMSYIAHSIQHRSRITNTLDDGTRVSFQTDESETSRTRQESLHIWRNDPITAHTGTQPADGDDGSSEGALNDEPLESLTTLAELRGLAETASNVIKVTRNPVEKQS